jgi:hypothetical protein
MSKKPAGSTKTDSRSAKTGRFVTGDYAKKHKATTVTEHRRSDKTPPARKK